MVGKGTGIKSIGGDPMNAEIHPVHPGVSPGIKSKDPVWPGSMLFRHFCAHTNTHTQLFDALHACYHCSHRAVKSQRYFNCNSWMRPIQYVLSKCYSKHWILTVTVADNVADILQKESMSLHHPLPTHSKLHATLTLPHFNILFWDSFSRELQLSRYWIWQILEASLFSVNSKNDRICEWMRKKKRCFLRLYN